MGKWVEGATYPFTLIVGVGVYKRGRGYSDSWSNRVG